jgi:hypothetical protein
MACEEAYEVSGDRMAWYKLRFGRIEPEWYLFGLQGRNCKFFTLEY